MDKIINRVFKASAAARKTSVTWNPDEPHPQTYYGFDTATSSWVSKSPSTDAEDASGVTTFALYSWNIDFMLPFAEARMKPALAYLERLTSPQSLPPTTAPVIFLQECTQSDMATITATPWIRERFHLTDIDRTNWASGQYGTSTLVDRRVPIAAVFRVHYSKTRMDRDALFVDIFHVLDGKKIRFCNTHLESLALEPPFRPHQMQLVARYMHDEHVYAALAAGDFNAIQPFDRTLHVDGNNNLKDAFLELGGKEDTEESFTWGQQASTKLRKQFGCSRMDKVYFCGHVKLIRFERFGEGVLTEGEAECKQIVNLGFEKPWVTDHLGVMAEVEVMSKDQV